jgi:hypothetical protein
MEMKKVSSGRLRGIGYDERARCLRVELDSGELLEYDGITREMWVRLSSSTAPWSYYCDNIRDELTPRQVEAERRPAGADFSAPPPKKNPLDDLFK